jgi:hypothetical protein
MSENGLNIKELTQMINQIMGGRVLTEAQLEQIMRGARKAHEQGGMPAVLQYLMHVTQADVDYRELKQFADQVKSDPGLGMDYLKGKKKIQRKKK